MTSPAVHGHLVRKLVAMARIGVGLDFGAEAMRKVSHRWLGSGADFVRTVQSYQAARAGGFYHLFVTGTLLPHAGLFALLVTLGECVVAISLILGLLTRLGALTALWLNLNFMLLKGLTSPSGTIDRVFLLAAMLFLVTAAGGTWGLDGRFRTNFSRQPLARWLSGSAMGTGSQQATSPTTVQQMLTSRVWPQSAAANRRSPARPTAPPRGRPSP